MEIKIRNGFLDEIRNRVRRSIAEERGTYDVDEIAIDRRLEDFAEWLWKQYQESKTDTEQVK